MATDSQFHEGWGITETTPPLSPRKPRSKQRKSAFTKSGKHFKVVDIDTDNGGDGSPLPRPRKHTTIEIERELDVTPEREKTILPIRPRSGKLRRQLSSPTPNSQSEDDDHNNNEEEMPVPTTDSEQGPQTDTVKIPSALLLAEETAQILGSPMTLEGSKNYWTSFHTFSLPTQLTEDDWEQWKSLTFYPSNTPMDDKLIADIEQKGQSDDGEKIIEEPAQMAQSNWNRLKWRLLKQNANYWFGSEGKLICYPDPYRKQPIQLFREDETLFQTHEEPTRNIKFVPARVDFTLRDSRSDSSQPLELELDLGFINFTHHPFFSPEHVVASNLLKTFEIYSQRVQERITEKFVHKLVSLRESLKYTRTAITEISEQLENSQHESSNVKDKLEEILSQHKSKLKSYRNEIRKVSLARDQGYWDDKTAISAVLETWKELRAVRDHQGYSNTALKLNIIELPSNPEAELDKWTKDVEHDLQDIEEESQDIFEAKMARYRGKMKEWTSKKQKQEKKGTGDETDYESDLSLTRRPKPPQKPNVSDFKKVIEKRYKEIRRRPGEPNIVLELLNTGSITPIKELPDGNIKEIQRRKALKKCKVELHLWLNGNTIFSSSPRELNQDFTVFMGYKVPITSNERIELLEIEIVDLGTKIRTLKIPIQIPSLKTTIEKGKMQKIMFFADDILRVSNAGVGSGVRFQVHEKDHDGLHTKGNITMRCGWVMDQDISYDSASEINKENYQQNPSLASILNDNSKQISSDQHFEATSEIAINQEKREFGVDELMNEFNFCDDALIEKSLRYKLLLLRDQGVPEFKNIKMVSPHEKDISPEIFQNYERRIKEDIRKRNGEKNLPGFMNRKRQVEADFVHESNRLEKIREIRLNVLQLFEKSLKQVTFEDLVVEEQIPDIGTLGLNLMSYFQPRRPLRPIRKERKRVQASNLVDTKIDLIFNIVRAFNLPLRKDSDAGLITTESLTGIQVQKKRPERGNYSTVRPFVEVWFQRKKVRTTTALGANPTWNQELQLNLTVPNDDYSQNNLSKMDDTIFLLIYDEVSVDLLEDERRRDTDIYQRIERRWLGSISIPFSTLYNNGRIEGTFKLNMPPVLLGYEPQGMSSQFGGSLPMASKSQSVINLTQRTDPSSSVQSSYQTNAFVTIFITLQPAVQPSISIKEDNATGESGELMAFVKNWKSLFAQRFPDRFVRPFVMTAEGDTILCTRYLTPIMPPDFFLEDDSDIMHTMELLAHYVSLFPYVRDSTLGITDYSLWVTSDVFISTPGGGVDDHAVLLACFFLHLNVNCWIVQGNAIPDGPTTFVISTFKGMPDDKGIPKSLKSAVLIWNPLTGEFFNANDNFCPLQKVWSAIGKQNIWANVSDIERPHQLDWNIGKSKNWLALFTKPMPEDKIPCVQSTIKRYKAEDQTQANSLAQRIERNLKDAFMKWRSTSKTNWNRYCSATLRRLLPKLEENKCGKSRSINNYAQDGSIESAMSTRHSGSGSLVNVNEEHLHELREVMTSFQMSGFPLQQSYVNMHSIMESVFATGVHTIDTPDVEFALAAYAQAYPASVYSVWIYVAALHRRK